MKMTRRNAAKVGVALASYLSALNTRASAEPANSPVQLDRSKLVPTFADEFDGPLSFWDLKTHKGRWKTNWFAADPFGPSGRISNEEIAVDPTYCGINPFRLENGTVSLQLSRTTSTDPRLGGKKLTTGLLTTERSFKQTYGYFECKLASPDVPGCWPAFWLYSSPVPDLSGTLWDNGLGYDREWSGGLNNEIDVVEILTNNTKQTYHTASAVHTWKDSRPGSAFDPLFVKKVEGTHAAPSTGTTRLHGYGVLWTKAELVWYVDNVEVFRAPNPGIHDPMYMIISMGAGGWNGNALLSDFTSATMVVDYVRAYALKGY